MQKWIMTSTNEANVRAYLEEGWEPFAVTARHSSQSLNFQYTIWLRKKAKS